MLYTLMLYRFNKFPNWFHCAKTHCNKSIGLVGVMLASLIGSQFDQANSQIARIYLLHFEKYNKMCTVAGCDTNQIVVTLITYGNLHL